MNKKILLAEDDRFLIRAYADSLERAGFEVILALNGIEAMRKIKAKKPDLILLDLVMPEKDGFEVLEELRMDNELKKIPVIILSNLVQDSDVKKGRKLGAVDYLIKSDFFIKKVIDKINFHLAKSAK